MKLTIFEVHHLGFSIDLGHSPIIAKLCFLLLESLGQGNPNTTRAAARRETKRGIWAPRACDLVPNNIRRERLEVGGGHALPEPRRIHLPQPGKCQSYKHLDTAQNFRRAISHHGRGNGPDFKIVRSHKDAVQVVAHGAQIPLVKRLGLVARVARARLQRGLDETLETQRLLVGVERGDAVLEGVRYPAVLVSAVRDALVLVPVVWPGQRLVEAVIKVFVVGEDDMTADIVKLKRSESLSAHWCVGLQVGGTTYEAFGSDVGRGETAGSRVGINNEP